MSDEQEANFIDNEQNGNFEASTYIPQNVFENIGVYTDQHDVKQELIENGIQESDVNEIGNEQVEVKIESYNTGDNYEPDDTVIGEFPAPFPEIKRELDGIQDEEIENNELAEFPKPFEVKTEITEEIIKDNYESTPFDEDPGDYDENLFIKHEPQLDIEMNIKSEPYVPKTLQPDAQSVDSSDSSFLGALCNVEACLQDEIDIKCDPYEQQYAKATNCNEEASGTHETDTQYKENGFQLNSITGDELPLQAFDYTQQLACPKCPKTFKRIDSLSTHLLVHETIERNKESRRRGIAKMKSNVAQRRDAKMKAKIETKIETKPRNERRNEEEYICSCGEKFIRRSRMETCLRSHETLISYNCTDCKRIFMSKPELEKHRRRVHIRKRYACKFCPTEYDSHKQLLNHLRKHKNAQLSEYKLISKIIKNGEELRCLICKAVFNTFAELKVHILEHSPPYDCTLCKVGDFKSFSEFANHTKTVHPEIEGLHVLKVVNAFYKLSRAWKCAECHLHFKSADELAGHKVVHTLETKVKEEHQCGDCRRVFFSAKSLTSHRRVHQADQLTTQEQEMGYLCVYCRKICKDDAALTSHMRFHSLERKFVCKFCDFRFATAEKRKCHAEIHTGDLKFVCFICEYQCSSMRRLNLHKMSAKHQSMQEYLLTGVRTGDTGVESNVLDVPCDICGEMFANEKSMLEHKQTHPFIEFPNDDTPTRIFFK